METVIIQPGSLIKTKKDMSPSRDFAQQVSDELMEDRIGDIYGLVLGALGGTCGEVVLVIQPKDPKAKIPEPTVAAYYVDELNVEFSFY